MSEDIEKRLAGDKLIARMIIAEMDEAELLEAIGHERFTALAARGRAAAKKALADYDASQAKQSEEPHPPPPEILADALQDKVHKDIGRGRPAQTNRTPAGLDFLELAQDLRDEIDTLCDAGLRQGGRAMCEKALREAAARALEWSVSRWRAMDGDEVRAFWALIDNEIAALRT